MNGHKEGNKMEMIMDLNEMKADSEKFVIVERFPEINYVLLKRDTDFQPWIAAWGYDKEKQYWGQGHYFESLLSAMRYIDSKIRPMPYDRVAEIASRLMDMVKETDDIDETLYEYDIELDDDEKKWFCIETDEEEE